MIHVNEVVFKTNSYIKILFTVSLIIIYIFFNILKYCNIKIAVIYQEVFVKHHIMKTRLKGVLVY